MNKKQIISLAGIFILACGLMVFASVAKKHRTKIEWDGNPYQIENVNAVDAFFARPYNRPLDKIADGFVALMLGGSCFIVAISFLASKDKKETFKATVFDAYTYCMCFFYSNGVYRILKTFAGRIRPYMYFSNPSEKGIAEFDFFRSWPSGHSANVFLAFAFLLVWFKVRYPDSKYRKPVLTVGLIVCVATMILRMLSGNHFLTDVLSGATFGFVISYCIAVLCNKIGGLAQENK